jgi:hypothetical protein
MPGRDKLPYLEPVSGNDQGEMKTQPHGKYESSIVKREAALMVR